jgi:alkylhydroperoxidase family enzyme
MAVRIEPVDDGKVSESVRHHFELAEKRGAPNATLLRILARDPRSLDVFYDAWNAIFYEGSLDHGLKEIVRVRMARLRGCGY